MKLSEAELRYLRAMKEGPQPHFGKGRVRCHNSLSRKGLTIIGWTSGIGERASITTDGLRALEASANDQRG